MYYIKAAKIISQDGTPVIAITAYMPQLHTKAQELIYLDILKWFQQDIIQNHKDTIILMSRDLQATSSQENERLHYPPITHFCDTTAFAHITPKDTFTYIPAKTRIDHWLVRQPIDTQNITRPTTHI